MTRSELEHLIRAAGAIAGDDQIVVIGSQSVLAQFPNAPQSLRISMEADLYPLNKPELAEIVDGAIGEGSRFHEQFGYYAQGVSSDTAVLPRGWEARLVPVKNANTEGVEGLCLEVHDLAIAKYAAGREKDLEFTRELARHRLTQRKLLLERLKLATVAASPRRVITTRIANDFSSNKKKRS